MRSALPDGYHDEGGAESGGRLKEYSIRGLECAICFQLLSEDRESAFSHDIAEDTVKELAPAAGAVDDGQLSEYVHGERKNHMATNAKISGDIERQEISAARGRAHEIRRIALGEQSTDPLSDADCVLNGEASKVGPFSVRAPSREENRAAHGVARF